MVQVQTLQAPFHAHFQDLQRAAPVPGWLQRLREAAFHRFSDVGFPTTRHEDWRYTNVAPLARIPFTSTFGAVQAWPSARELAPHSIGEKQWSRLVFLNGAYAPGLSSVRRLPRGTRIGSLMELLTRDSDLVEAHLARYASFEEDAFTALNTAFIQDGAVVVIPDNAVISRPIELLFLTGESSAPLACHPRSLVLLGRNAKVTVIERYLALEGGEHFANAITEVALGPGASLSYYRLQPPGGEAFHVGTTQVWQGRDSRFAAFTISMSGRLTRNNVRILLEGEGASCTLDGLYLASGQQHVDTHTLVHHARPHTGSQQRYKGALAGRAHGVFHGRVLIPRDAFQARAHQVNKNLLLSDEAEADTKPQLEIFTDDVKCTHGASVGQLDDEAVFYLTARGLRQHDARLLLTYGFTREMLEAIQQERVRAVVEGLVDGWLTASLERA